MGKKYNLAMLPDTSHTDYLLSLFCSTGSDVWVSHLFDIYLICNVTFVFSSQAHGRFHPAAWLKEAFRYNASIILRNSSETPVSHSTIPITYRQSPGHCLVPATFDQMNPGTTYSPERSSGSFKRDYQEPPTHSWVIPPWLLDNEG